MAGTEGDTKFLDSKVVSPGKTEKKKKKQIILLAILIPIFIYVFYANIIKPASKPKAGTVQSHQAATTSVTAAQKKSLPMTASKESLEKEAKSEGWGRNPFSFNPVETDEEGPLQLKGIVFSADDSYAVINQKILKEGDRIADKTIIEIRKDKVIIESDDGTITTLRV